MNLLLVIGYIALVTSTIFNICKSFKRGIIESFLLSFLKTYKMKNVKKVHISHITPAFFTGRVSLNTGRAMSRRSGHDLWTNQWPASGGGRPIRGQRSAVTAAAHVDHFQCLAIAHSSCVGHSLGGEESRPFILRWKGFSSKRLRGLPFLLGTGCAAHKMCSQVSRS